MHELLQGDTGYLEPRQKLGRWVTQDGILWLPWSSERISTPKQFSIRSLTLRLQLLRYADSLFQGNTGRWAFLFLASELSAGG